MFELKIFAFPTNRFLASTTGHAGVWSLHLNEGCWEFRAEDGFDLEKLGLLFPLFNTGLIIQMIPFFVLVAEVPYFWFVALMWCSAKFGSYFSVWCIRRAGALRRVTNWHQRGKNYCVGGITAYEMKVECLLILILGGQTIRETGNTLCIVNKSCSHYYTKRMFLQFMLQFIKELKGKAPFCQRKKKSATQSFSRFLTLYFSL